MKTAVNITMCRMSMEVLITVIFFNNFGRKDDVFIWNRVGVFKKVSIKVAKSECHFTMKSINFPNSIK